VHSEKFREFASRCVNSLAPISEWSAFPASHVKTGWRTVHCGREPVAWRRRPVHFTT
jgi:hypothetical protein